MTETWKPIKGYEDLYAISERGEVWSIRRRRYLKSVPSPRYMVVGLCNGSHITHRVHVLVAKHFLGERPLGHDINHIDGNRYNNHVDNLEYVTHKKNVIHSLVNGLHPRSLSWQSAGDTCKGCGKSPYIQEARNMCSKCYKKVYWQEYIKAKAIKAELERNS